MERLYEVVRRMYWESRPTEVAVVMCLFTIGKATAMLHKECLSKYGGWWADYWIRPMSDNDIQREIERGHMIDENYR